VTSDAPSAPRLLWQTATIRAIGIETARVKTFTLALARPFVFRAGQHVDVRLTAPDGYQAQRSYSIASAPAEDGAAAGAIALTIEQLDDGEVSPFFHEVAAVGDDIELRGPIGGHFVWSVDDGGPVLLLGGGSGVVPLASMLRHRAARASASGVAPDPMALVLSARTFDQVIYRDELLALDGRDGFHCVLALTRDRPRRAADHGRRIDAAMVRAAIATLGRPPALVFACGANAFVNAATDATLAAGVPAASIRTERYGG
jgi:ferredoxin-NADP reductase